MHETCIGGSAIFVGFRVINPDGFSRGSLDGSNLIERRAGVYYSTNHERYGFIHHRPQVGIGFDERIIGRVPTPCNLEISNIVFVNLIDWNVFGTGFVRAINPPFSNLNGIRRANNQTDCTKNRDDAISWQLVCSNHGLT